MSKAQTAVFRDKEATKQAVERAGLRVPRHGCARTAPEAWAVVERVGYPAIIKPIDGAGSKDTYRCDDGGEFEQRWRAPGTCPKCRARSSSRARN